MFRILEPLVAHAALTPILNPLTGDTQANGGLPGLTGRFVALLVTFLGFFFLGAILYGGFLWLTSRGNSESLDKGKGILVWSIIGIIIVAGAYAIVQLLVNAINGGGIPFGT